MSGVDGGHAAELVSAAEVYRAAAAAGIVVIGCGAAKRSTAAPAAELYTGQHFRACKMTAEAIAPGRWWILSAAHGLVHPARRLQPYDVRLGDLGAVTWPDVHAQALTLGLLEQPVTAFCGAAYADLLAAVFPVVSRPLAGLTMGYQRGMLRRIREAA